MTRTIKTMTMKRFPHRKSGIAAAAVIPLISGAFGRNAPSTQKSLTSPFPQLLLIFLLTLLKLLHQYLFQEFENFHYLNHLRSYPGPLIILIPRHHPLRRATRTHLIFMQHTMVKLQN